MYRALGPICPVWMRLSILRAHQNLRRVQQCCCSSDSLRMQPCLLLWCHTHTTLALPIRDKVVEYIYRNLSRCQSLALACWVFFCGSAFLKQANTIGSLIGTKVKGARSRHLMGWLEFEQSKIISISIMIYSSSSFLSYCTAGQLASRPLFAT